MEFTSKATVRSTVSYIYLMYISLKSPPNNPIEHFTMLFPSVIYVIFNMAVSDNAE